MWEFNYTDEMYTGKYDRSNNSDRLYHSDVYLGQDYSDGIKHWKYIKKVRKNGKWVYYYKDDNLANLKKQYDTDRAAIEYENGKRMYGQKDMTHQVHRGKVIDDPTYNKLADDVVAYSLKYKLAKNKSDQRKKKYKTPIKVLNKMSYTSYNIRKKIKKGKKALAKLFKKKKKK